MDSPRQGVLPSLDQWAVLLEADMYDHSPELPDELPTPPTVDDLCAWLDAHLHWWVGKPEWDEFADAALGTSTPGIVGLWRWARMLAGVRDEPVWRCRDEYCGGVIAQISPEMWHCRDCGREYSAAMVRWVTLADAAEQMHMSVRTLQRWARRNLLGQPLDPNEWPKRYDLNLISRVAAEERSRGVA